MKILIFGTFDHLHLGHEFVINAARERGETFVVIALDETVQQIKGHTPKQSEGERFEAIAEKFPDTFPLLGDEHDYLVPVHAVEPDLILLGYDQQLPPGVSEDDLPCAIERLEPFEPERYKSSRM